ncbi:transcriptional regulator with XRE-family HTH domain [Kitasatospora sp. MAA4]|uniref:helix-turn-helix domain-containing protein n=1 Tax=Kitasatospora sp. MAA4 TaxID=3035093 RepID=UPI0024736EF1|nr:helix-turn-helix transcriptional regulator [Kitasatospora sp. MAA4]MDH6134678.1 transcriptional regulator with XRE-family HTH domain [Kitasatospora sp. MAA4]
MSELPEELTPGERIRVLRERRGMTRPVLAGLVGRSTDWLKKIESGERPITSHALLLKLASALHVTDLSALTGPAEAAQPVSTGRLFHPASAAVWAVLLERGTRPPAPLPSGTTVAGYAADVDAGWRLWHKAANNRTDVGLIAPDLIRHGETLSRTTMGAERRAALVALAAAYRLAQQVIAYIGPAEAVWMLGDRAMSAAADADDPAAMGAAAWNLANTMRAVGEHEGAMMLVTTAAERLRPHLAEAPEHWRGLYGALHLHASITEAREGRDGSAWNHWDTADQVSKSLPAGYAELATVFGRANVDLHAVSIATELRSSGKALTLVDEIDPDSIPSTERRTRLWVDAARSHMNRGDRTAALHVMGIALKISPETVKFTPQARSVAAELWRKAPRSMRAETLELAETVGIMTGT